MASKDLDPKGMDRAQVDRVLRDRKVGTLKYYDGEAHEGIFFLPKYIREGFRTGTEIIRDKKPLTYRFMGEEKNSK
jgi:spermidine synthase